MKRVHCWADKVYDVTGKDLSGWETSHIESLDKMKPNQETGKAFPAHGSARIVASR